MNSPRVCPFLGFVEFQQRMQQQEQPGLQEHLRQQAQQAAVAIVEQQPDERVCTCVECPECRRRRIQQQQAEEHGQPQSQEAAVAGIVDWEAPQNRSRPEIQRNTRYRPDSPRELDMGGRWGGSVDEVLNNMLQPTPLGAAQSVRERYANDIPGTRPHHQRQTNALRGPRVSNPVPLPLDFEPTEQQTPRFSPPETSRRVPQGIEQRYVSTRSIVLFEFADTSTDSTGSPGYSNATTFPPVPQQARTRIPPKSWMSLLQTDCPDEDCKCREWNRTSRADRPEWGSDVSDESDDAEDESEESEATIDNSEGLQEAEEVVDE